MKIANTAGSTGPRWAVLLTGGLHAREVAPPNALVSFLEKLMVAYAGQAPVVYPAWKDPVDGIRYDPFTVSWPWVREIVEKLDLYVAPLVNPDGRDWVLTKLPQAATKAEKDLHWGWRKNRAPAPAGNTDPRAIGVDINRNFDIVFDFATAYDMTIDKVVYSSTDPIHQAYTGPSAASEPETQNVANLMHNAGISFFMDYHAYGRDILYCWGIETNQSTDQTKNFANSAWDHRRDGTKSSTYEEYIPAGDEAAAIAMAQRIRDQILNQCGGSDLLARARSQYKVMPASTMYVTSGTSQDYCFARWFTAASAGTPIRPVMSFVLEVGGDLRFGANHQEGGFTPNYVKHYPKIEREIHVATWTFLAGIAASPVAAAVAPAGPSGSSNWGSSWPYLAAGKGGSP